MPRDGLGVGGSLLAYRRHFGFLDAACAMPGAFVQCVCKLVERPVGQGMIVKQLGPKRLETRNRAVRDARRRQGPLWTTPGRCTTPISSPGRATRPSARRARAAGSPPAIDWDNLNAEVTDLGDDTLDVAELYADARRIAALSLDRADLPERCPYALQAQVMETGWHPDAHS